jgi:hypothetical protein
MLQTRLTCSCSRLYDMCLNCKTLRVSSEYTARSSPTYIPPGRTSFFVANAHEDPLWVTCVGSEHLWNFGPIAPCGTFTTTCSACTLPKAHCRCWRSFVMILLLHLLTESRVAESDQLHDETPLLQSAYSDTKDGLVCCIWDFARPAVLMIESCR